MKLTSLKKKAEKALADLYAKLTPWEKTLVARHPNRPHAIDYINNLIDDFTQLDGDRLFKEDAAIIAGIGRFNGSSVAILGQEKG